MLGARDEGDDVSRLGEPPGVKRFPQKQEQTFKECHSRSLGSASFVRDGRGDKQPGRNTLKQDTSSQSWF